MVLPLTEAGPIAADRTHASGEHRLAVPASQRVGALGAAIGLLRSFGCEPGRVLESAGLAPDALDASESRIPYASLGRLLEESSLATGCAHFGLLLGRAWHVGSIGIAGDILVNSPTVGEGLRALAESQYVNSDGGVVFVLERAGVVDMGYAICNGGDCGVDQVYDAVLAISFNVLRELCGAGWNASDILVAHRAPHDLQPYRSLFKVEPRFDCEFSAIRFPAHWMARPIAGADPARLRDAEAGARAAGRQALQHQVRRVLRTLLLQGACCGDDVAERLGMNRRTLNRRLQAEGTTYQCILDQVRFEVACQLLAHSELALDDVAATLGYASVSPFMRTFRRWSGTTPSRWRRDAGAVAHGVATQPEHGVPALASA